MSAKSEIISTQLFLGMQKAIDDKDMAEFNKLLSDPRLPNSICGDKEKGETLQRLCAAALRAFT